MKNTGTGIGLNIAVFLMMLGVGMIMALLPQRMITVTRSTREVAYLASAFAVSYIALQVPIGRLADRLGAGRFIVLGYLVCCATGILYFFSNRGFFFLLGRLFQGAGEAPVWALAPALLSVLHPHDKGKAMGLYNASIHVGLTLGPLLGLALARLLPGNYPFLFYAGACLLGALVSFVTVTNRTAPPRAAGEAFTFRSILRLTTRRSSLVALAGIALYGAGYGLFLTAIPSDLITARSFDPSMVSIYFTVFYLTICLSQLFTGPLVDRYGTTGYMIGGLCLAAAALLLFPRLPVTHLRAVLAAASLGLGIFYLSSMAFLNGIVPAAHKGTVSGAYYLFWGIGFFFGPILIARLNGFLAFLGYSVYAALLLLESLALAAAALPARRKSLSRR